MLFKAAALALGVIIILTLWRIAMNQAELAVELGRMKDQNEKSRAENLLKLQALEDAINNAGQTSPDVDTALAALRDSLQTEDDENPDAAAPTAKKKA